MNKILSILIIPCLVLGCATSWRSDLITEQSSAHEQYMKGFDYLTGIDGPIDVEKAIYWYKLSAAKGDERAKWYLDRFVNAPAKESRVEPPVAAKEPEVVVHEEPKKAKSEKQIQDEYIECAKNAINYEIVAKFRDEGNGPEYAFNELRYTQWPEQEKKKIINQVYFDGRFTSLNAKAIGYQLLQWCVRERESKFRPLE